MNQPTKFQNSDTPENLISLEETIEKLKSEIKLRERYEKELEESRRTAEQATQYKSQFLANMSHEIRTPLGLILGFTEELINSSQLNPTNRHLISTIRRNSEILARLIDDILDLSKIEAGKIEFDVAPVRACEFIKDLETNFEAKCMEKGLVFHFDVLSPIPEYFYSDEIRIKQILLNLISNAIRHTDKGGLILKVSYSPMNCLLYFDVIDSGDGIPYDKQTCIFESYKQAHKGKQGTGLGLTLSRSLARGLQGDLKLVRSGIGEGSWFRVEIKNQVEYSRIEPIPKPTPMMPTVAPDLTGRRVLIVDDLLDNVRLMEAILRPTKALVDSTLCSRQAVQKCLEVNYDLVLMDLQMPEQNGFETIRILKESRFQGQVWAVSACAMKSDFKATREAGFKEHVSKPIKRASFYQKLNRWLQSH